MNSFQFLEFVRLLFWGKLEIQVATQALLWMIYHSKIKLAKNYPKVSPNECPNETPEFDPQSMLLNIFPEGHCISTRRTKKTSKGIYDSRFSSSRPNKNCSMKRSSPWNTVSRGLLRVSD